MDLKVATAGALVGILVLGIGITQIPNNGANQAQNTSSTKNADSGNSLAAPSNPNEVTSTISTPDGNIILRSPNSVEVKEKFNITVEVENNGSTVRDFRSSVYKPKSASAAVQERVELRLIQPSTTQTKEVGPFTVSDAGTSAFGLTENEGTNPVSIEVVPREVPIGQTQEVDQNFNITLNRLEFPFSILTMRETAGYLLRRDYIASKAPEDEVLVEAYINITNTKDDITGSYKSLGPDNFQIENGEIREKLGLRDLIHVDDNKTTVLDNEEGISPGESERRLITTVDRDSLEEGYRLGYKDADSNITDYYFETNPSTDGYPIPDLELTNVDYPETINSDNPSQPITITVRNNGQNEERFIGSIVWKDNRGVWVAHKEANPGFFDSVIQPGSEKQFKYTWTGESIGSGEYTHRITPFGREFNITQK